MYTIIVNNLFELASDLMVETAIATLIFAESEHLKIMQKREES